MIGTSSFLLLLLNRVAKYMDFLKLQVRKNKKTERHWRPIGKPAGTLKQLQTLGGKLILPLWYQFNIDRRRNAHGNRNYIEPVIGFMKFLLKCVRAY